MGQRQTIVHKIDVLQNTNHIHVLQNTNHTRQGNNSVKFIFFLINYLKCFNKFCI
jgi:hypothetical protein